MMNVTNVIETWNKAKDDIQEALIRVLGPPRNPIFMMSLTPGPW